MSNTEISQTYDIYVGKNVVLTNWNGLKQYVRILKNNKHLDPYKVSKMIKQQVQNRKKFYAQTSPIKQKLIGELESG